MGLEHLDTAISFVVIMLLLSMLVTILVQCVIALSGLRGWNLHYGVMQLLEQMDPGLKDHAKSVAKAVLEHPSIAHMPVLIGGRRKATAIRPEELLRILKQLTNGDSSNIKDTVKTALSGALAKVEASAKIDLTNPIQATVSELTKLFPTQAQAVEDAVNRGFDKVGQAESRIKGWFDTIMDRTTERFLLYTRWITAVIAFALAIFIHVDSIQLYKQLSGDPALRAKLVQSAEATLQQAGSILENQVPAKSLATEAIHAAAGDLEDEKDRDIAKAAPNGLITRNAGIEWLSAHLPDERRSAALDAYNKRFEQVTLKYAKELGASFQSVEASLAATGVQIALAKRPASKGLIWYFDPGVLITGLFLSLGAPFWFNALKQLANLRPTIAAKVQQK